MSEFYAAATTSASVRRQMEYLKGNAAKIVENHINQASTYIRTEDSDNPLVYSKTCITLGSTIDSAIAMNVVPSSFHLPQLLLIVREVYRRKTELQQPSLMLLMLPIKAACKVGWFSDGDKADLLMIVEEVCKGFSDTEKMSIEPNYAHSCVSNIILRFYPTMKVENILTSFDVKAGYGTFVVDFHISQGTLPRNCRNLWLLVARMDNMDTVACIANPSNVDFLINGKGVPKRTKSTMGKGPQLPSNVTKMIKYGVNLLQVLGDFDVAFMNLNPSPDLPPLKDYVHTTSTVVDSVLVFPVSDCNVIGTSSLISLDCPISKLRIRTPVKGHLCKHPQCFDYKYFLEVNSRWPTWNCPICNIPLCYLDVRIDQTFVKMLNEVAEDVSNVMVSANGSWTVATKTKRQTIESITRNNNHVPNSSLPSQSLHTTDQADAGPSTTEQAQSTTVALAFEHLRGGGEQQHYTDLDPSQPDVGTTEQAQSTTISTPPPVGSQPQQAPPPTGDVMPVRRMRGSLRGDQLAEARDRLLAPPRQPVLWSRPTATLPIALLMQPTTTNSSHNTLNLPN
ncbi:E4 SUMO-protein ligase PIAL1 isoform X2 [Lactuca sativa]|uniref:E4 SUMO-protein ligase PIAL1 isoform X2 n=1 Tax=Lactuca sativa TaxID=4236 RepID=UPI000CD8A46E|nr:E4 SUMO-protein ligase PIAL1 isoform X2 [Lactuca sativa]